MTTETRSKKSSMSSRRLAPPMLDNSILYRSWINITNVNISLCGVDKKKQGINLLPSVSNNKKAEKAVSNLTTVELYTKMV